MSLAPWQQAPLDTALAAWRAGRLAHGLLLCGPEALGKRAVADALAARLVCEADPDVPTCGECRGCRLRKAGTHPDLRIVTFEVNENTEKMRTELVVDQVRGLGRSMQMTAQRGGAQVVVIDPAEALNGAAANALLKTLEEPADNRFLILVSASPARLSATIRSRCQRLLFHIPEAAVALGWLAAQGHAPAQAQGALDAAQGHPGLADRWLREGQLALREATLRDWASVAQGRAAPLAVAQGWLREDGALRLRFVADAAAALARASAGGALPAGLTRPVDVAKLGLWFDQLNRLRLQLRLPLKHELALAGLLGEWRDLSATKETRR